MCDYHLPHFLYSLLLRSKIPDPMILAMCSRLPQPCRDMNQSPLKHVAINNWTVNAACFIKVSVMDLLLIEQLIADMRHRSDVCIQD